MQYKKYIALFFVVGCNKKPLPSDLYAKNDEKGTNKGRFIGIADSKTDKQAHIILIPCLSQGRVFVGKIKN